MKVYTLVYGAFLIGMPALSASGPVQADAPLAAPADVLQYSRNHEYLTAISHVSGKGVVYAVSGGKRRKIWTFSGYSPLAFVSDDGRCVALCYAGNNLLPLDCQAADVFVTFYHAHARPRSVTIGAALGAHPILNRTVSHYNWGNFLGFESSGLLDLRTDQGHIIRLTPSLTR